MNSILLSVDVQILIMVASLVIPILHGLVIKASASDASKVALTLVLSAVAGLVATGIEDSGNFTKDALLAWGATFVVTISTHYGLFKPLDVSTDDGLLQKITGGRGIGVTAKADPQPEVETDAEGHNLPWS
jgi:hypothetical protein